MATTKKNSNTIVQPAAAYPAGRVVSEKEMLEMVDLIAAEGDGGDGFHAKYVPPDSDRVADIASEAEGRSAAPRANDCLAPFALHASPRRR